MGWTRYDAGVEPLDRARRWKASKLAFGGRALSWLGLSIVASFTLAGVEFLISAVLQVFLQALGLLRMDMGISIPLLRDVRTTEALAVVLLAVGGARAICQYFVNVSHTMAMEMITARLRRLAIYELLLGHKGKSIDASTVNLRIGEYFVKASLYAYAFAGLLAASVQAFGIFLAMGVSAPRETGVAVVGLGILGLGVRMLNRRTRAIAARVPEELEAVTRGIERVARNVMLVRVLRTERREHQKFVKSIDAYAEHSIGAAKIASVSAAITPFVGIALIVLVIVMSQRVFHTQGLVLLSFLYLFMRFVQALAAAVQQSSTCHQRAPQFDESLKYVLQFDEGEVRLATTAAAIGKLADEAGTTSSPSAPPPSIEISHVTFAYDQGANVISDLSLSIPAGGQFAVVGTSGGGKSTLLGLILGILDPSSGSLRVGGRDPKAFASDPKTRIGYVGAESFLISGTVRENLTYGFHGQPDEASIMQALSDARLRDVVDALPGKLEYKISEDGSGLSAGQKQRLCLARALLAKPGLLVLDEASANLDENTERELADSLLLLRERTTVLLVSHRQGLIRNADAVVRLEGGVLRAS